MVKADNERVSSDIPEALRTVDGPSISQNDFERLFKGKLADVIDLVACSVVGRGEAKAARAIIQQNRDSSTRSKLPPNQDLDPLHNGLKRAETRLKGARILIENERKTHDEQMQLIRDLEHDEHQLQESLKERRMTSLLLAILERKERIRKERFAEIAKLLEDLRQKAKTVNQSATGSSDKSGQISTLNAIPSPTPPDLTKDVLSALQAYSIRMMRLAAQANDQPPSQSRVVEAERHLLNAVARSKGLSVDDATVSSVYENLRASAQSQALRHVRYDSPISVERDVEDMDQVVRRNSEKEDELQRLADHSAALALACAQSLQVVSHFAKNAVPSLRAGLQNESENSRGHVDNLRLSVVNRTRPPAGRPSGGSLGRGQTLPATLSNLEQAAMRAQASEVFIGDVDELTSPDPARVVEHTSLIDTYTAQEADVADRIAKLLERKAKKAAVGHTLVEDIERLTAETASIAGGHI